MDHGHNPYPRDYLPGVLQIIDINLAIQFLIFDPDSIVFEDLIRINLVSACVLCPEQAVFAQMIFGVFDVEEKV